MTKLGKPKRTRNRVPISCENCRKRKLKCNRKHPCSNCIKSHKIFLCKYAPAAGIVSTSKVQLTTEILRLKAKVNQLEHILKLNNIVFKQCDDKSLIQFDYRNGNYDICSDQVKSKQDPLVCLTDKFDQLIIQDNKLLHSGTTTYTALIGADKRLAMLSHNYMHNQKNWYKDYKLTLKKRPIDYPEDCIRTPNEYSYNLGLINKINAILPTLQCVNTLIDNFFKQVYPLFPFVDEDTFRKDMDCIILPLPNGGCKIALIHIHNIATVSLLLLFLRFAYVSLRNSPYDSLKNVEVGPEYIEYSRKLIFSLPTQDSIFKRIDLRNVQVLLYLRIYQGYGPDVTEESFENSISLATIVQMVRIAGGDRDPDNYSMKFRSKGQDRIFRYVFYELLYLDAFAAFDYGCPLLIHKNEYDVKLPMLDEDDQQLYDCLEGGKDISDVPLVKMRSVVIEKIECMTTSWESEAIKLVSQGLKSFQNVKQGSKKSSLEEIVFKIDDFIKRLPTISVLIGNTGTDDDSKIFSYAKIYKIPLSRLYNLRLKMLSVANTFWYLLFLNENETGDAQIVYEFGKGLYVVKATEAALLLFKNAYDYLMYYTNGNNKTLEKEKDVVYEIFSLGLEPFLINRTLTLVQRSLLWLFSFLLSNIESNGHKYSFKDILPLFSVSVRKFVVSDWFNVNCSNKQCVLNLFHYLKKFYFLCVSIKDQYIIARHTASRINIFFNFLKESNRDGFNKYVDTKMMFPSNEIKGIPDMDDAVSSETASSKSLTTNPELEIQDIINGRSNVLDDTDTDPFIAGIELLWPKADTNSTVDEIDEREDEGEEQNYYDIPKMDKYWPMQKPMRLGNEQVNLTDILEELKRETTFDPG